MTLADWLTLAGEPGAGFFLGGVVAGWATSYVFLSKYLFDKRMVKEREYFGKELDASEALCAAKINAMQQDIDRLKPIAEKWETFMERKALEALS